MPLSKIKYNHKRACHGNGFTADEKVATVECCILVTKEKRTTHPRIYQTRKEHGAIFSKRKTHKNSTSKSFKKDS